MARGIRGRAVSAAALCVSGGLLLSAQQRSDQAPFRSGVELVSVDVGVVDRQGHPVRGLAAGEFSVTVGGQQRRVVTAEFVDTAAARAGGTSVPEVSVISTNEGAGIGRLFAFVVDQGTLEPGHVRHVAGAASKFFAGLSFVDRSALMLMPSGPNVPFTWAHDRVREALGRVVGQNSPDTAWEFGSLTEARDIANRSLIALRNAGQRECGGSIASAAGGSDAFGPTPPAGAPAPGPPPGGAQEGGGQTGGSERPPAGGGAQPGGSGGSTGGRTQGMGGLRVDNCTRDIQMRAEWAWRGAQMTSFASITALRHLLSSLQQVRGDKTVILVSGGWPLDDREQHATLAMVAEEAAAARVTVHSLFVPPVTSSAGRRMLSTTPVNDHWIRSWPLETLASMTGGGSYRIEVGAETAFDRIARELSGFYRIGVEKDLSDRDGKARRMKVQVSRRGVHVRAREIFDVRTFEDRDWTARLSSALDSPIPATAIGLRVTSYVTAGQEDPSRLTLVLAGEASRVDPGDAEFQIVVHDLEGKRILAGEKPIGEPTGDGLAFFGNVPLPPGGYIVRLAVIDGAGRIGSVDHRVDVRPVPLGSVSATGPLLVRVPAGSQAPPRVAVQDVRRDERLALQVDLAADGDQLATVEGAFEIAATADGPALLEVPASMSPRSQPGTMAAQGVAELRLLPPGQYLARAKFRSPSGALGEVRRPFTITDVPHDLVEPTNTAASAASRTAPLVPSARAVVKIPAFAVEQVLAPAILGAFLDRVAARTDAASPMIREILAQARTSDISTVYVSDVLAAESPVAAFVRGLSLLAQNRIELAANAFRSAMRVSADFYPAMVYLGACYAAGGNDKEAAGAWRTALIKEKDSLPLHVLLSEALLRQGNADLALQTIDGARARWSADDGLKRRFVVAALLAGEYADGFEALDELVNTDAGDEPSLAAGLLTLHEAFVSGRPIGTVEEDRARIVRLADAYRKRGGPSLPLVEAWVAAATRID